MPVINNLVTPIYPGKGITLKVTFKNAAGTPISATGATLKIKPPNSSTVTYTDGDLTTGGTGVYMMDYVPTVAGKYSVRWQSTTPAISEETSFTVTETGTP